MSSDEISVDYVIDATHLTWVDDKLINELMSFLEDKLSPYEAVLEIDGKKVLIGFAGEEKLNKRFVKTYIKRFLHKYELLDRLRVISSGKDEYTIHKLKHVSVKNL
ncbi:MAG: 60S ribosomal protein L22 [Candidatus Helarchaeota archaeon]